MKKTGEIKEEQNSLSKIPGLERSGDDNDPLTPTQGRVGEKRKPGKCISKRSSYLI